MKRKGLTLEFKRAAVARLLPGVKISALAEELGICRQRLYEWRDASAAGDEQLRRPGRPKHPMRVRSRSGDPTGAQQRVAELERKVGQQQLELDFFQEALRRVETSRRPSNEPGAAASTLSSKRRRSSKAD